MGGLLVEGGAWEDGTLDVMVVPLLPEGDDSNDGEDNQNDSWMIQVG